VEISNRSGDKDASLPSRLYPWQLAPIFFNVTRFRERSTVFHSRPVSCVWLAERFTDAINQTADMT